MLNNTPCRQLLEKSTHKTKSMGFPAMYTCLQSTQFHFPVNFCRLHKKLADRPLENIVHSPQWNAPHDHQNQKSQFINVFNIRKMRDVDMV